MTNTESKPASRIPALAVGVASLLITVPVILMGSNRGRGAADSVIYHQPFIDSLAESWPSFDLSNPLTATTPGYHILLATLAQLGLGSETAMRLVSAMIASVLVWFLATWIARRPAMKSVDSVVLAMPLACSIYVVFSGAWLLPDNLAWIGVLGIIVLCLHPARRSIPIAAAVLALLVFTRQVHIWAAAPIWVAAWLGVQTHETRLFDQFSRRFDRAVVALLWTLPAFGVVVWFINHWGGLTPPRFQTDMHGGNPATPAFILAQIPILMIGFGPWLVPPVLDAWRTQKRWIIAAGLAGFALAAIPVTTYDIDAGRYSGWWILVKEAPLLFGRTSPVFLLLTPIGAMLIVGVLAATPHRPRWILSATLLAFAAAQSATMHSWQRYHEPFLLLLLAILAVLGPAPAGIWSKLRIPAMGVLLAVLLALTARGLRTGDVVEPGALPPAMHTMPEDPWANPTPIRVP